MNLLLNIKVGVFFDRNVLLSKNSNIVKYYYNVK